jgi:hypothetical protein
MFLKGDLVQRKSAADLREYRHNLTRLWKAFKAKNSAMSLAAFDSVIKDIDKFERIRYPDGFSKKGMFFSVPIIRPSGPTPPNFVAGGVTPPTYSVVVGEVDALVRAIFDAGSLNPQFEFMKLSAEGREILHRENTAFPTASQGTPPRG